MRLAITYCFQTANGVFWGHVVFEREYPTTVDAYVTLQADLAELHPGHATVVTTHIVNMVELTH